MLRRLDIRDRKLVETDADDAPVLIYVDPDEDERRHLIDDLCIDPHTLSSSLDPHELGRVEFEPDHTALIIKRPKQYCSEDNFLFKISSAGIFLFRDRLVIVVAEDTLRFEGKHFLQLHGFVDLILKVIYRAIWHFEEHLRVFSMIADDLEHKINTSMENKHLLNMFTLEKSLVYYLNAISSNGRVIDKLKACATRLNLTPEDLEFIEDMIIESNQCHEMANTYSQVLAGLVGARASVVSNNLNMLMKQLMLLTIALMLPTMVFSLFGMNVKLPIEPENGYMGFWIIMFIATASGVGVLALWRYKKW